MERICTVKFSGVESYFVVTNENDVIQRNFIGGTFFEEDELKSMLDLHPEGICLDIGANVGNHTVFFARHCDFSKVLPFEPNPVAAAILRRNIEINKLENVDLRYVGIALGSSDAEGKVVLDNVDNLGTARIESGEGEISVRNGDALLADLSGVGFVKIDVEGMEIEVLKGLTSLLRRERPIIYIEVSLRHEGAFKQWCSASGFEIDFVVSQRKYKRNVLLRSTSNI